MVERGASKKGEKRNARDFDRTHGEEGRERGGNGSVGNPGEGRGVGGSVGKALLETRERKVDNEEGGERVAAACDFPATSCVPLLRSLRCCR